MENQSSPLNYLDFNASSPLHPELIEKIPQVLFHFGNPSSIHWAGRESKTLLREARENIAKLLNVQSLEIIFTSGGSEANTTVLDRFMAAAQKTSRNELITTKIEHPSISQSVIVLRAQGIKVHEINVDRHGNFDWTHFQSVLSEKTALVSAMFANNETGVLLPIKDIAKQAHAVGAKMHTDAVQALGKVPLDLKDLDVDFASFSGHKFYSLKGTGVLYVKKGNELGSLIFGGGQERKRRGGTENTLGIWSLGVMALKKNQILDEALRMKYLRDMMEARILNEISDVEITHRQALRLPNTSSLILRNVDGDTLLMSLDVKGFAISTGSACSSGRPEPSLVLRNIGLSHFEAQNSLRISFGWMTTENQVHDFVDALKDVVQRLRKIDEEETLRKKYDSLEYR